MGYSFTFGAVVIDRDEKSGGFSLAVESPSPDPEVHSDEWEAVPGIGSPQRSVPYGVWAEIVKKIPALGLACEVGRAWGFEYEDYHGTNSNVPCAVFLPFLENIEMQARTAEPAAAARALWFVRWCRRCHELYGNMGAFEWPGEWFR